MVHVIQGVGKSTKSSMGGELRVPNSEQAERHSTRDPRVACAWNNKVDTNRIGREEKGKKKKH
jgi:hypothetical protein